jgi:tetratricopeptide (TPR) repeat protein
MRACTASFLFLLALAGCVTTEQRLRNASTDEAEGHFAEAANGYMEVLEKRPDEAAARAGLERTGAQALDAWMQAARTAEAARDYDAALEQIRRVEDLLARAQQVQVTLPEPDGLAAYREQLVGAATAHWIAQGEAAEQSGNWATALSAYDRVLTYPLAPEQQEAFTLRRARVWLSWGAAEREQGRYRSAYDKAGEALAVLDARDPQATAAQKIQQESLQAGERPVAFLPFTSLDQWDRQAPSGLRQEINDLLVYERLADPPVFLRMADPVSVRRELRRLGHDSGSLDRGAASEVGRALQADFVIAGEMIRFERTEKVTREERKKARTKGRNGLDTTYTVQQVDVTLTARIEYHIFEPQTRRLLHEDDASITRSYRLERGAFPGDPDQLDLSSRERRLFDAEDLRETEDNEANRMAEALAEQIARQLFEYLLAQIP